MILLTFEKACITGHKANEHIFELVFMLGITI